MKHTILLMIITFFACSKEPVEMDVVLFERSGQWITNDDFSKFFFFNRKVYNGPAFISFRTGEKREQGLLKNGFKTGSWTGWDKEGKKKYDGEYIKGNAHGKWTGFYINGQKKYEGLYAFGLQTGKWTYYNEKGKKNLEETYYNCDENCEEDDEKLGRLIETKEF